MVLSSFGLDVGEKELRALCDCTVFGTDALKAVDAARRLGFPNTTKNNLVIDELMALVRSDQFPIVFLSLAPIDGFDDQHAAIIVEMNESDVVILDPIYGERVLPVDIFELAWALQLNLAILVSR